MKTTNKNINANNANNAQANNANAQATKKPTIYVGLYREIKAAAQTPSAVVKQFYNAALSINGGEYAEIYKKLLGGKNDFCAEWAPKVVTAFQAQSRCKKVTLFFVWRVVYKQGLGDYLKTAKAVAKATKGGEKRAKALEALEGLGEATKATKKNNK